MGDLIQFIPRSTPKPVTINHWPDISPLECMAIDIVNQIFPDETDAAKYHQDEKDPA
jgi:hypothetical protein